MNGIRDGTALAVNAAEDAKVKMREEATIPAKNTAMRFAGIGAGLVGF